MISVKVPEPEFEGQTKNRLGNPEVKGIVDQVVNEELIKVLEWHPKVSFRFLGLVVSAVRASVMIGVEEGGREVGRDAMLSLKVGGEGGV